MRKQSEELECFRGLVLERTGLDVGNKDDKTLRDAVMRRLKARRSSDVQTYFEWLGKDIPAVTAEWGELVVTLTAEESYFLRDRGQFAAIRNFLFPDLIERARARRKLRIWSAGCARGEEPYSLAILIREVLPEADDWDIRIVGTDINKRALAQAERGTYSTWSLRGMDAAFRDRYFTPCEGTGTEATWQLKDRIRRCVTFHHGDLFRDEFPFPWGETGAFDLILCRNVFIYFDRTAVARMLSKTTNVLRPGGYLITGHGELHGLRIDGLKTRLLPETLAYWRPVTPAVPVTAERPSPHPPSFRKKAARARDAARAWGEASANRRTQKRNEPRKTELDKAREEMHRGDYGPATERLEGVLTRDSRHFAALLLKAQMNANMGIYEEAWSGVKLACEIDPFAAAPYYLMAQLSEVEGDFEAAKADLKKAIYLEPRFTAAYLDLAGILEHQDDTGRAEKFRSTAWELLQGMPADSPVEPYDGVTAKQLRDHLREVLKHD